MKTDAIKELEEELDTLNLDLIDPNSESILFGFRIDDEKFSRLNLLADKIIKQNRKEIDEFEFPGVKESELLTLQELYQQHRSMVGVGKDLMRVNGKVNGYLSFYTTFKRTLLEQFDVGILLFRASNISGPKDKLSNVLDSETEDPVLIFKKIAKKIKRSKADNFPDAIGVSSDDFKKLKIATMIIFNRVGYDLVKGQDVDLPDNFIKSISVIKNNISFLRRLTDVFDLDKDIGPDGALFGALSMIVSRDSVAWSMKERGLKGDKHATIW